VHLTEVAAEANNIRDALHLTQDAAHVPLELGPQLVKVMRSLVTRNW